MVEAGVGAELEKGVDGAGFGVAAGVDEARETGLDEGAGAHGAGFEGDVHDAVEETPVVDGLASLAHGDDFGVGGGVVLGFAAVEAGADDFGSRVGRVVEDEGADGDFVLGGGFLGELERLAHPVCVIEVGHGKYPQRDSHPCRCREKAVS